MENGRHGGRRSHNSGLFKRKPFVVCIVILAILFSAAGCSGGKTAAETSSAEDNVRTDAVSRYYAKKAETDSTHDYSHMDLRVLDGIASSSVGTAVDTEELSIDVAGAIFSGNTAEIILRVTAKKLDTVLYDNGIEALSNYRFGDETAMLGMVSLGRQFYTIHHIYTYSDTDDTLAPNQFYLHYRIITPEPIDQDMLSIPLSDFGCYSSGGAGFEALYKGNWDINIAIDPVNDDSRVITVGKEITVGDYRFSIETIQITPLACTVQTVCTEDETTTTEHMAEIINACSGGRETIALTLSDGTVLDSSQLDIGGRWSQEYPFYSPWTLSYYCPTAVKDVVSVSLFGSDCSLTD